MGFNKMGISTCAFVLALSMSTGALFACSSGSATSSTTASTGSSSTQPATDEDTPAVASKEDIAKYCGSCHFQAVDNDAISSFNKSNVDSAMVRSMDETLTDAQVDSIVAYFATIEPQKQQQ